MSAMAKAQKKKAQEYESAAEKLLAKKSWFSSSRERNQEEAAETLLQAANAYKVGGLNQEAGGVYMRVGEIYQSQLSNNNEAAKAYTQAGELKCLRNNVKKGMKESERRAYTQKYYFYYLLTSFFLLF